MLILLIILIISLLGGLAPALIAKNKGKNFILWYIYGFFALPAAIIHSLLIHFNIKKFLNFFYAFLVFYALIIFYFFMWFISTQPVAMAQESIAKKKYLVAEKIINDLDNLSSTSGDDLKKILEKEIKITKKQLNKILGAFDANRINDTEYVKTEVTKILNSIEENFNKTIARASYEEWSVPKGKAAKVFKIYIDSLKLINKLNPENIELLETNYENILNTEALYFKRTKIAVDFIKHLDSERLKEINMQRKLDLISKYEFVGDKYKYTNQKNLAKDCYESAISINKEMISIDEKEGKDIKNYIINIAKLQDKKEDINAILENFEIITKKYFEKGLFTELKYYGEILDFFNFETIKIKHNMSKAINVFLNISTIYKAQFINDISLIENKLLKDVYPKMNNEDRLKYSKNLIDNYKYFISTKALDTSSGILETTQIVQEAYLFFKNYKKLNKTSHDYYIQLTDLNGKINDLLNKIIESDSKEFENEMQKDIEIARAVNFEKNNFLKIIKEIQNLENMKITADTKASGIVTAISNIKTAKDIYFTLQKRESKISRKQIDKNEKEEEEIDNFAKKLNNERDQLKKEICIKENGILLELFGKMIPADKDKYSKLINENYKFILTTIGTDKVELIMQKAMIIKEAYTFFDTNNYPIIKGTFVEQLKLIDKDYINNLEKNLIDEEYSAFSKKVNFANQKNKIELIKKGNEILETINNIKTIRALIKELVKKDAKLDKINEVEAKTIELLNKLNKL